MVGWGVGSVACWSFGVGLLGLGLVVVGLLVFFLVVGVVCGEVLVGVVVCVGVGGWVVVVVVVLVVGLVVGGPTLVTFYVGSSRSGWFCCSCRSA
ncbi:hypothetical protein VSS93_28135 [Pseudomonas syringae pv. tagetis]